MYSLYKQATVGRNETTKPALWNPIGRAKWTAWAELGSLDRDDARRRYLALFLDLVRDFPDSPEKTKLLRLLHQKSPPGEAGEARGRGGSDGEAMPTAGEASRDVSRASSSASSDPSRSVMTSSPYPSPGVSASTLHRSLPLQTASPVPTAVGAGSTPFRTPFQGLAGSPASARSSARPAELGGRPSELPPSLQMDSLLEEEDGAASFAYSAIDPHHPATDLVDSGGAGNVNGEGQLFLDTSDDLSVSMPLRPALQSLQHQVASVQRLAEFNQSRLLAMEGKGLSVYALVEQYAVRMDALARTMQRSEEARREGDERMRKAVVDMSRVIKRANGAENLALTLGWPLVCLLVYHWVRK